jgi:hypothetical protein
MKMNCSTQHKNGFRLNTSGVERSDTDACGFQMTFENGWTISVQWAEFNYSQRTDRPSPEESKTAECAVWDHNGDWFKLTSCDDVQGWMSPDEVAALITRVAAFPVGSDILDEEDTCLE